MPVLCLLQCNIPDSKLNLSLDEANLGALGSVVEAPEDEDLDPMLSTGRNQ